MTLPKDPIKAEETKRKISDVISKRQLGKPLSEAHKISISRGLTGFKRPFKPKSEEHKRKIGEGNKGKIISDETREKIRLKNIGKKLSETTKQKISKSNTGKIISEATRLKLIVANTGRKHTKETKRKISESNKKSLQTLEAQKRMHESRIGKQQSLETRLKMSSQRKGELNSNYKDGTTPLYKLIRSCTKMKEWKMAIFRRDRYKDWFSGCGGNLEAHHIISFTKLLRKHNIQTVEDAEKCEALWSMDIGITVLETSHKAYHNMWGKDVFE